MSEIDEKRLWIIEAREGAWGANGICKGELVRCRECGHYHSEDDPAYCDELCTIHIEQTDGCLRGIKRGGKVVYRAADGERKDGEQ